MKTITKLILLKEIPHHIFETLYSDFFHTLQKELLKKGNVNEMLDEYVEEAKALILIQLQIMEQTDIDIIASDNFPLVKERLVEDTRIKYAENLEEKEYFLSRRSKQLLRQRLH